MKKKVILLGIFLIIIGIILIIVFSRKDTKEKENINATKEQFKISKIYYYSDVNAIKNNTSYQNPEWNLNVYQYTDMAIYLERLEEYNYKNHIKSIYLDNINIERSRLGKQGLFYLNPLDFGKSDFDIENNENEILDRLEYNVVNSSNSENDMIYSIPIFFEDLSNPITLKYMNYDIIKNYTISNEEDVIFNGNLLQRAGVNLESIKSKIYMNLNIITKDDEVHIFPLELQIPLQNEEKSIYDGGVKIIENNFSLRF